MNDPERDDPQRNDPETQVCRFVLGEMKPSERAEFEKRLRQDESLQGEVRVLESTVSLLKNSHERLNLESLGLSDTARDAVMNEARREPKIPEGSTTAHSLYFRPWQKAAAAIFFVVCGGLFWHSIQSSDDTIDQDLKSTSQLDDSVDHEDTAGSSLANLEGGFVKSAQSETSNVVVPRSVELEELKTPLAKLGYVADEVDFDAKFNGGIPSPELTPSLALGSRVLAIEETLGATDGLSLYSMEAKPQDSITLGRGFSVTQGEVNPTPSIERFAGIEFRLEILTDQYGAVAGYVESPPGDELSPPDLNVTAWGLREEGTALGFSPVVRDRFQEGTIDELGSDSRLVEATGATSTFESLEDKEDAGEESKESSRESLVERKIQAIFRSLDRQPHETPSMMFFRYWGDNQFIESGDDALSTFSIDVDKASYTLARRYLKEGNLPPIEAVRTEEFVNYFPTGIEGPESGVFRVVSSLSPSPFTHEKELRLFRVALKAREVSAEQRRACRLTFVIDVSGSMRDGGRLDLVKQSLNLLLDQLDEGDRVGIVAFNDHGFTVLESVEANQKDRIKSAIQSLNPGGSTNAGEGLRMGYDMAVRHFQDQANNRVILCSDGVANVGATEHPTMLAQVAEHRKMNVYLNSIGVGMGNHNDHLLEQLADRGDGQCLYVDDIAEAKRAFVDELTGTLETVAKDVKVQVEFNPDAVIRYRQIGYENRAIRDQDFRNEQVDAGEVGAGHEVIALYEVLCHQDAKGEIALVRVRYKDPQTPTEVAETEHPFSIESAVESFESVPLTSQVSVVAAEFAELLRRSFWAQAGSLEALQVHSDRLANALPNSERVIELAALIRQASALRQAQPDDIARALEHLKETNYLMAQLEDQTGNEKPDVIDELKQQNEKLRALLRKEIEAEINKGQ